MALFHFARDKGYLANDVKTAADGLPVLKTDDEIERLTWNNVKWEQNVIEVGAKTSKSRQRRLVPLLSLLVELLHPYRGRVGPVVAKIKFHLRLRQLAEKAKTPGKHNALCHSFASYRLASEQNVAQLALETGNSPTMIFRHYRELTTPKEAKRWWSLGLPATE